MLEPDGSAPTMVYVAGYGRSGSTLFDMLLDQAPGVFGAGELTNVFTDWRLGRRCSCAEVLGDCVFWSPVFERWASAGYTAEQADAVTKRVELSRLHPRGWRSRRAAAGTYRRVWAAMLNSIMNVATVSTVVDSSKGMGGTARRQRALAAIPGNDVAVVQLVRDPRAVLFSVRKRRGPEAAAPRRHPRAAVLKSAMTWSLANGTAAADRRRAARGALVKYEDFVREPQVVVSRVVDELDMEAAGFRPEKSTALAPGHGIRGNRMRRSGVGEVRVDDAWRQASAVGLHRLAAVLTWPVAAGYGYNTVGAVDKTKQG